MIKLGLVRSQKEDKTVYAAARVGDAALFAAVRYDLRHLLRCICAGATMLALLRRTMRRG